MTFRIVLSVEAGHPDAAPKSAAALCARLEQQGVDVAWSGGEAPASDSSGGRDLPVTICGSPRPWYECTEGVELADSSGVEKCVEHLAHGDLGAMLLDPRPERWQAAVADRLADVRDNGLRLFLFGAGLVGRQTAAHAISHGVTPLAFLDNDSARRGDTIAGVPVCAPADLDLHDGTVVICTGRHHDEIRAQLASAGAKRILSLSELGFLLGGPTGAEGARFDDLRDNRFRYIGLLARLTDEASRRVLAAVLRHRLTLLDAPLRDACSGDQWFIPEVFAPRPDAVFVDGGAYDGDSAAEFVKRSGGAWRALELFEPDKRQAERARRRLASVDRVRVHAAGLSDAPGTARFTPTGGMDGSIAANGCETVDVVTVDDTIGSRVTYLKLDVEGGEEAALRGARRAITAAHPVLAIAAYHRAADLWRIPAWIDALGAGYRLYLSHHTELAFETVVYARA